MICDVLHPGQLATVQDDGRIGHQQEGIPVAGPMDRLALRVANLLVGNDVGTAVLECTLVGPTVRFDEHALIALTGGDLAVTAGSVPLPLWRPICIPAGTVVSAMAAVRGCRGYIGIAGGIDVPPVLGSRSTYVRASLGGMDGRPLRRGDRVPIGTPTELGRRIADAVAGGRGRDRVTIAHWGTATSLLPRYTSAPVIRVLEGEHTHLLTPESAQQLWNAEFRVGAQSDRMGYRLEGPMLPTSGDELLSFGLVSGAVQVPRNGQPILLMADCQTAGGYPVVATVVSASLPVAAQLLPGDEVRFAEVTPERAGQMRHALDRALATLL